MDYAPLALIVSHENFLSNKLAEKLRSKLLKVDVTLDVDKVNEVPNYIFILQGLPTFFDEKKIEEVINFAAKNGSKTLIILPYVVSEDKRQKIDFILNRVRELKGIPLFVAYLGETYGVGMDFFDSGYLGNLLQELKEKKEIGVPAYDFDIYHIGIEEACDVLIKGMFSYGYGKKEIVIAKKSSVFNLSKEILALFPVVKYRVNELMKPISTVSNFDFLKLSEGNEELKKTVEWLLTFKKVEAKKVVKKVKKVKVKLPFEIKKLSVPQKNKVGITKKLKIFTLVLLMFFWILSLPFLSFFVSTIFLKQGMNRLENFDLNGADFYFGISKSLAHVSGLGFSFFDDGKRMSDLSYDFSVLGQGGVKILKLGKEIVDNISGNDTYDLEGKSRQLSLDIDEFYKDVSFAQADRNEFSQSAFFLPNVDLKTVSGFLSEGKEISKNLTNWLGQDKQKTYLILLQDGNELRPTGGKINSFGIVTFDKGRLVSKNFYDVNSVSSQLRGHVEAPFALKKYLGVNNWNLADSNWDSDFRSSAQRAQWFLRNGINQNTDGVISVDLSTYNKMQNFNGNFLQWGIELFRDLQNQKILVYLNDETSSLFDRLKWSGAVNFPTCGGNCVSIPVGIVEANLGGNQVNSGVTRSINLKVGVKNGIVTNKMEISFTNFSKNEAYRDYIRVLTPVGSRFDMVNENVGKKSSFVLADTSEVGDRQEAGVSLEIPASSTAKIVFSWTNRTNIDLSKSGRILLYMRRQPGVSAPVSVVINDANSYNTDLSSDFYTTLYLKQ